MTQVQLPENVVRGYVANASMTAGATANLNDAVNLFVNYLPLNVTDADLLQRFSPFGRVLSAKVMRHLSEPAPAANDDKNSRRHRSSKRRGEPQTAKAEAPLVAQHAMLDHEGAPLLKSKGYGFVLMSTPEEAAAAIDSLHGTSWETKRLVVQIAQRLPADTVQTPAETAPLITLVDTEDEPAMQQAPLARVLSDVPPSMPLPSRTAQPQPLRLVDVAVATVSVGPVDPTCSLSRLCSILDSYGVIATATMMPGGFAHVTFSTAASAVEAARWLNGSRVPQVCLNGALQCSLVGSDNSAPSKTAKSSASSRRPRRSELVANSATTLSLGFPELGFAPPQMPQQRRQQQQQQPQQQQQVSTRPQHPMPVCNHGPLCRCGAVAAGSFSQPMSPVMKNDSLATALSAHSVLSSNNALGQSSQLSGSHVMRRDPYSPALRAWEDATMHQSQQAPRVPSDASSSVVALAPPAKEVSVVASPNVAASAPASQCQYCDLGTTVILQNMPFEDVQCELALNDLLGPIGYFCYWECWGDGRAVAVFPDRANAQSAVELLNYTEQQVDFYDCASGLPASVAAQGRY